MAEKDYTKKIGAKVQIVSISSIAHGGGALDVLALGSDQKVYRWDYRKGTWLQNWESKEEKDARLKMELKAKKMQELQEKIAKEN